MAENAKRALELVNTIPTSPHQAKVTELQAENTQYQLEARFVGQKIKELMEEGEKVMLKMVNLRKALTLSQHRMQVDSEAPVIIEI